MAKLAKFILSCTTCLFVDVGDAWSDTFPKEVLDCRQANAGRATNLRFPVEQARSAWQGG